MSWLVVMSVFWLIIKVGTYVAYPLTEEELLGEQ